MRKLGLTLLYICMIAAGPTAEITPESAFPLTVNDKVEAQLTRFTKTQSGKKQIQSAVTRMKKHAAILDAALAKHDLPREILAIPVIESGYRNIPQSKKQIYGAGIWMFVKGTARKYGLKISPEKDQRLDITLSTDAAMRLLKAHYEEFGDWELALLAYNAGEGTVRRGIKATGSRDAWQLIAAGHVNDPGYLAKVIAVAIILNDQGKKSLP